MTIRVEIDPIDPRHSFKVFQGQKKIGRIHYEPDDGPTFFVDQADFHMDLVDFQTIIQDMLELDDMWKDFDDLRAG